MKRKKILTKLALNKKTVVNLGDKKMNAINAGMNTDIVVFSLNLDCSVQHTCQTMCCPIPMSDTGGPCDVGLSEYYSCLDAQCR